MKWPQILVMLWFAWQLYGAFHDTEHAEIYLDGQKVEVRGSQAIWWRRVRNGAKIVTVVKYGILAALLGWGGFW